MMYAGELHHNKPPIVTNAWYKQNKRIQLFVTCKLLKQTNNEAPVKSLEEIFGVMFFPFGENTIFHFGEVFGILIFTSWHSILWKNILGKLEELFEKSWFWSLENLANFFEKSRLISLDMKHWNPITENPLGNQRLDLWGILVVMFLWPPPDSTSIKLFRFFLLQYSKLEMNAGPIITGSGSMGMDKWPMTMGSGFFPISQNLTQNLKILNPKEFHKDFNHKDQRVPQRLKSYCFATPPSNFFTKKSP